MRTVGITDVVTRTFESTDRHRLEEDLFEAVTSLCADNGVRFDDLDFICMSAVDQIEGRIIQSMVTAGSVGAVGRELMTIVSAPEHAFAYTWMRLRGDLGRHAVFVTWGYPSEMAPHTAALYQMTASEPIYQRAHGLTPPASWALLEHGLGRADATGPSTSTIEGADTVCAMLLSSEEPTASLVTVTSCGWASDNYDLGVRPVSSRTGLANSLERVLDASNLTSELAMLTWAPTESLRQHVGERARAAANRTVTDLAPESLGACLPATGAHPVLGVAQLAGAVSWLGSPDVAADEVLCAGIFGAAGQNSFATLLRRPA